MCKVCIQNHEYTVFERYKLNTKKQTIRYELESGKPITCKKSEPKMKQCKCGNSLIPLAYRFDNGIEKSNVLLGRKCIDCGANYFSEKTINRFPKGFEVIAQDAPWNMLSANDVFEVHRGDIFYVNLKTIENCCGSEQTGLRPVLVIQNDKGNAHSTTTIVAIITSRVRNRKLPTHVELPVGLMEKESEVCLEQLRTIDIKRFEKYVNNVYEYDKKIMESVNEAIKKSLAI